MSNDFGFTYKNRVGRDAESSLMDLSIVAEGPVDLGNGWTGDRVNYDKKNRCFIEFRTGKETIPGHVENYACEVDVNYVIERYAVSKEEIESRKQ
jgi:hypothetical protein